MALQMVSNAIFSKGFMIFEVITKYFKIFQGMSTDVKVSPRLKDFMINLAKKSS